MNSKPRNFDQALDELEKLNKNDGSGSDLRSKLERELAALEEKFNSLKPQMEDLKAKAQDEIGKTKVKVEAQVKENPWLALGVVGLIFFVLGCLFSSRRND